ncbi:MAG: mechanosensitive ion channel family protein [Gemmatimonadales bacterium]
MDLSGILDPDTIGTMLIGFIPKVLAALLVFGLFWLLQRLTRPSLRAAFQRASLHETLIRMLVDNLYRPALLILGGIMAAGQIGINVTALLAGISVAGVAFGFAAQDTLANVISGFLIFWDKPFTVGDYVTVQDQYGRVVDITMRSTRIRTVQNTYVIIPNRSIIDAVMVNHTKHGEVRVEVPVGIAYKESIPEARRVLLAAVTGLEGVAADPAPDVVATVLGSSSVDLLVRVWVEDSALERPVFYRTLEASKLALDAAGIQIPYHHLQLFLDKVEEPVWQRLSALRLAGGGQSG